MDRRDFMSWVGVGFVASSLPMAIAACTAADTSSTAAPGDIQATPTEAMPPASRPDGFVLVGTATQLNEQTFIEDTTASPDPILVVRDPKQADQLIAISGKCTHKGCNLDWEASDGIFACGCHGSQFEPNGTVKKGPAQQALKTFSAKIEGDAVLIKVAG